MTGKTRGFYTLPSTLMAAGLAAIIVLGVSGCAGQEDAEQASPETAIEFDDAAYAQEHWERAVADAPNLANTAQPNISRVRFIEPSEFSQVMITCLTEAGVTSVEPTPDGEGFMTAPNSQAEFDAATLAGYSCAVKYPTSPKYSVPLDDGQLSRLYDYFAGPQRECLEGEGYQVSDPPSKESFIDNYSSGQGWDPFIEIVSTLRDATKQAALAKVCPALPAGLYE